MSDGNSIRIAIGAFVCILNRRQGRGTSLTMKWLRQHSKGEIKRSIRAIRETPALQREGYPVEEIVRLLREEVMGKGLIQEIAAEARTAFPEWFTGNWNSASGGRHTRTAIGYCPHRGRWLCEYP